MVCQARWSVDMVLLELNKQERLIHFDHATFGEKSVFDSDQRDIFNHVHTNSTDKENKTIVLASLGQMPL